MTAAAYNALCLFRNLLIDRTSALVIGATYMNMDFGGKEPLA